MKNLAVKFLLPFLICFLLFTPLGLFSDKIDPFQHSSFFSLTTIDAMDDQGYMSYLRSLVFDGDIDFYNENNYAYYPYLTQTGYTMNLWPVGPAVLWAPFFIAAQGIQATLQVLGLSSDTQGYGWSHLVATGLATGFYVFCGLLLLYRTLILFFSRQASLISVWTLFLSSPLLYFTFIRSRMGAFCEFFTICLFLYLWCHPPGNKKIRWWSFSIGCSLALAAMSRPTNAVLALLPLTVYFSLLWENLKHKNREAQIQTNRIGLWALLAFMAVFALQGVAWFTLFGSFYPNDPHLDKFQSLMAPTNAGWLWNRLTAVLAGSYFGLFYCFQAWLMGFFGLFFLPLNKLNFKPFPGGGTLTPRSFKWVIILLASIPFFLTLVWAVGEASSFGRRYLIGSIPFIAFGFSGLYDRCSTSSWKKVFLGASLISILLSLAHMVLFRWKLHYFDTQYSWHVFSNLPHLFTEPAGLLSTSFFRIVTWFWPSSPVEWFFVVGIPFLMTLLLGAALLFCGPGNRGMTKHFFSRCKTILPVVLAAITIAATLLLSVNHKNFSKDELSRRIRFTAIMKNYPEFIFNNTSPGNEKELKEAVRLNPQSSRAFLQLGTYYLKTGDLKQAAWYYEKSLARDPLNHNSLWALGMALKAKGEKEYFDYFAKALTLQPHRTYRYEYLFEKANEYFFNKQYRRAIETQMKVTRLAPSWGMPYENIAINYFYLQDFERSRGYALKAKARGKDVSKILSALNQVNLP